jgi:dTDP-4-dehydrorhamnose reductase
MTDIFFNNILIIGGNGMVGNNINYGYKPSSVELDITNVNLIQKYIHDKKISCIINLAATNLRESENNLKKAINININGTINLLKIAKELEIPYVLISSGAVFSSKNCNEKFDEDYITCPNCIYGITKESSEKIALLYEKIILIRTGWLFGGNQKNHYKFVENTISNLLCNNEIKASNNFYGSPTYVIDLLDKMKDLIINKRYGIHHIVNSGYGSGYDIALEITIKINKNLDLIKSVSAENIPNSGPLRSNSEILETKYKDNILRNWKEALSEYIDKYLESKNNKQIISENKKLWKYREKCRLCNSTKLTTFFNLEPTPPANHYLDKQIYQEKIPLDISICENCKHIQLLEIVEPSYLYSNYLYVSSASNTMINHLHNSVKYFSETLNLSKNDNILEIGANDGTCVSYLLNNGFKNTIGIDPAKNINTRHNLPIICDFFGSNCLDKLKQYAKFKLIFGFHCFAHIENIQDIFNTIYELLDDSGVFIMEVGYFYEVFKNKLFDTIYHEHIDYHTCYAMQQFISKLNMTLYKVSRNNIQGGAIQFFISKNKRLIENNVFETILEEQHIELTNIKNLNNWKKNIINIGTDLNYFINTLKNNGKKIAGYGASAKSTTFLYQYKINQNTIDYIIDDSIFKQNLYSPGLHIPIKPYSYIDVLKVDYILILSWNFADDIIKKLENYIDNGLRIIIPFPNIKII